MLATMIDAVTTANFPLSTKVAACYMDGRFANVAGVRARLPKAQLLTLTTQGGAAVADGCDSEEGDLTATETEAWVAARIAAGQRLIVVYANLDRWINQGLLAALAKYGDRIKRWLSHPDGVATIPAGYDAKQYLFEKAIDVSVISSTFLTPWTPPKPPNKPKGTVRFKGSFNLATGQWAIKGAPGLGVHFAGPQEWASAEVQIDKGSDKKRGHWRIRGVALDAQPLG